MTTTDRTRSEELLEQILTVIAATAVDGKSLSEGAPFLDRLGVERGIITTVYDTSDGSVRAVISQAKAKKGKKP